MAKTWEQIIAETGIVSEEQSRKDQNELLQSMGMSWFDFMMTDEYNEIAKKIAEVRYNRITNRLMAANREKIDRIFQAQIAADKAAEEAAGKTEEAAAEEQAGADQE